MEHPAIALLEMDSVVAGITAADAMVKRAPIGMLKAGTVHPGGYLILIGGTVASVQEAHGAVLDVAGRSLTGEVLLPDVHPQVYAAVMNERSALSRGSLAILETSSSPALLRAADAAVKATDVRIGRLRLSDDLGGRAFLLLDGEIGEVQAACEIACERIDPLQLRGCEVIPRLDDAVQDLLNGGTRFASCALFHPEGAESDAAR